MVERFLQEARVLLTVGRRKELPVGERLLEAPRATHCQQTKGLSLDVSMPTEFWGLATPPNSNSLAWTATNLKIETILVESPTKNSFAMQNAF